MSRVRKGGALSRQALIVDLLFRRVRVAVQDYLPSPPDYFNSLLIIIIIIIINFCTILGPFADLRHP